MSLIISEFNKFFHVFFIYILLQAALAGLMGEMIYAPYDITGAKFLWWTWHDTGIKIEIEVEIDLPQTQLLFGL